MNNEHQWYESMLRFHTKRLQRRTGQVRLPSWKDLESDPYVFRGFLKKVQIFAHGEIILAGNPWDQQLLKSHYLKHTQ